MQQIKPGGHAKSPVKQVPFGGRPQCGVGFKNGHFFFFLPVVTVGDVITKYYYI